MRAVPDAIERVRPGWGLIGYNVPTGKRSAYFGFVWPEVVHVHLGFEQGILMDDPDRRLLGSGKKLRWMTFTAVREVDRAIVAAAHRGGGTCRVIADVISGWPSPSIASSARAVRCPSNRAPPG